jgi:hypothetical protein
VDDRSRLESVDSGQQTAGSGRCSQSTVGVSGVSSCSETVQVGRARVSGELLTVFNCSLLSFGVAIKFHLNRTLEYVTIQKDKTKSLI